MRRLFLGLTVAAALVAAAPAATATDATTTVTIKRSGFVPVAVTINQGDAVTWKNADTINHQVVANGGSFASPVLAPGKTYTHTFRSGGTFRYHDALHPTLKGTITVRGAPAQVTLAASVPVVKYGASVTLSGTVSNKRAGETVTIVQLPAGQTTKQVVATLQTTTGGSFSFTVTPQLNTLYQAQWKNISESSVTVQVMPLIKLPAATAAGYFHFYVTASRSFAGRYVYLQRFTLYKQWVTFKKYALGSKSGRIVYLRDIRAAIPRGRWSIRVYMPQSEIGEGYLETTSGTQPVVRK